MTGFVELSLLRHHHFSIEQAPFIDHQPRRADVSFDYRLPLENDFLGRDNGTPHFSADRDVLCRHVPVHLARNPDCETLACGDLTRDLAVDANITLTADLPFDDGSRANQIEFFDRISFQSRSSFRS